MPVSIYSVVQPARSPRPRVVKSPGDRNGYVFLDELFKVAQLNERVRRINNLRWFFENFLLYSLEGPDRMTLVVGKYRAEDGDCSQLTDPEKRLLNLSTISPWNWVILDIWREDASKAVLVPALWASIVCDICDLVPWFDPFTGSNSHRDGHCLPGTVVCWRNHPDGPRDAGAAGYTGKIHDPPGATIKELEREHVRKHPRVQSS